MKDNLPFKRAVAAIGGSAGVALTSLVLALCLIQKGTLEEYGLFAFLMLTQSLANGISNALLGSPLLIVLSEKTHEARGRVLSFVFVNILLSFVFSIIQASIVLYFSESIQVAFAYALGAFFTTLRWFGRSYLNSSHQHDKVVKSDAVFSVVSLSVAAILYYYDRVGLLDFGVLTAFSAIIAIPFLGIKYMRLQFLSVVDARLNGFVQGFKLQGRYALVGVLTTEGTLNAHSYLVTLLLGPAAFAPIAAAALLYRPVMVVLNSLAQIERPRIRLMLTKNRFKEAKTSLKRFQSINFVFWFANSLFVGVMVIFFIDLYWKDTATQTALICSAILISLIRLSRSLSGTFNVYLQAADKFKELSLVTVKSSLITLPVVCIFLLWLGPSFSLLGILTGELFSLSMLIKIYHRANV